MQKVKPESARQRAKFGKPFDEMLMRSASGCLEWTGKLDKDGYGRRGSRYGEKIAHRYAYTRAFGEIPEGVLVRHTCDNPKCCEPEHLVLGTQADNIADKVSRDRVARGEDGGNAKLTEEMVLEIRRLYAAGMKQTAIAKLFPVTQSSVSLIIKRRQWTHI